MHYHVCVAAATAIVQKRHDQSTFAMSSLESKLSTAATSADSQSIRLGVCGFCLPQAELFRRFSLLEVQQTFYWPPQLKTVERWRRTAPEDFEFTVKAFQAITHPGASPTYRRTKFSTDERAQCGGFCDTKVVRDAWHLTFELANSLEASIIVFQCPPSFDASDENVERLRQFFHWADRGRLRFGWEPRHTTWTRGLVRDLCWELELIHVVDPLEQGDVCGSPRYLRLHGKSLGNFRYDYGRTYTDEELADIYERCQPGPTYCLFNNKQMATDAERFSLLARSATDRRDTILKPR
jgi:uncharacterized protein YecE (DUF72 family)